MKAIWSKLVNTVLWQKTRFAAQNVVRQFSRLKFGENRGTPQTQVSLAVFLTTPKLTLYSSLKPRVACIPI